MLVVHVPSNNDGIYFHTDALNVGGFELDMMEVNKRSLEIITNSIFKQEDDYGYVLESYISTILPPIAYNYREALHFDGEPTDKESQVVFKYLKQTQGIFMTMLEELKDVYDTGDNVDA